MIEVQRSPLREAPRLARGPLGEDLLVTSHVPLARRHVPDAPVMVLLVVPAEELLTPYPGVLKAFKPTGVVGPSLHRREEGHPRRASRCGAPVAGLGPRRHAGV